MTKPINGALRLDAKGRANVYSTLTERWEVADNDLFYQLLAVRTTPCSLPGFVAPPFGADRENGPVSAVYSEGVWSRIPPVSRVRLPALRGLRARHGQLRVGAGVEVFDGYVGASGEWRPVNEAVVAGLAPLASRAVTVAELSVLGPSRGVVGDTASGKLFFYDADAWRVFEHRDVLTWLARDAASGWRKAPKNPSAASEPVPSAAPSRAEVVIYIDANRLPWLRVAGRLEPVHGAVENALFDASVSIGEHELPAADAAQLIRSANLSDGAVVAVNGKVYLRTGDRDAWRWVTDGAVEATLAVHAEQVRKCEASRAGLPPPGALVDHVLGRLGGAWTGAPAGAIVVTHHETLVRDPYTGAWLELDYACHQTLFEASLSDGDAATAEVDRDVRVVFTDHVVVTYGKVERRVTPAAVAALLDSTAFHECRLREFGPEVVLLDHTAADAPVRIAPNTTSRHGRHAPGDLAWDRGGLVMLVLEGSSVVWRELASPVLGHMEQLAVASGALPTTAAKEKLIGIPGGSAIALDGLAYVWAEERWRPVTAAVVRQVKERVNADVAAWREAFAEAPTDLATEVYRLKSTANTEAFIPRAGMIRVGAVPRVFDPYTRKWFDLNRTLVRELHRLAPARTYDQERIAKAPSAGVFEHGDGVAVVGGGADDPRVVTPAALSALLASEAFHNRRVATGNARLLPVVSPRFERAPDVARQWGPPPAVVAATTVPRVTVLPDGRVAMGGCYAGGGPAWVLLDRAFLADLYTHLPYEGVDEADRRSARWIGEYVGVADSGNLYLRTGTEVPPAMVTRGALADALAKRLLAGPPFAVLPPYAPETAVSPSTATPQELDATMTTMTPESARAGQAYLVSGTIPAEQIPLGCLSIRDATLAIKLDHGLGGQHLVPFSPEHVGRIFKHAARHLARVANNTVMPISPYVGQGDAGLFIRESSHSTWHRLTVAALEAAFVWDVVVVHPWGNSGDADDGAFRVSPLGRGAIRVYDEKSKGFVWRYAHDFRALPALRALCPAREGGNVHPDDAASIPAHPPVGSDFLVAKSGRVYITHPDGEPTPFTCAARTSLRVIVTSGAAPPAALEPRVFRVPDGDKVQGLAVNDGALHVWAGDTPAARVKPGNLRHGVGGPEIALVGPDGPGWWLLRGQVAADILAGNNQGVYPEDEAEVAAVETNPNGAPCAYVAASGRVYLHDGRLTWCAVTASASLRAVQDHEQRLQQLRDAPEHYVRAVGWDVALGGVPVEPGTLAVGDKGQLAVYLRDAAGGPGWVLVPREVRAAMLAASPDRAPHSHDAHALPPDAPPFHVAFATSVGRRLYLRAPDVAHGAWRPLAAAAHREAVRALLAQYNLTPSTSATSEVTMPNDESPKNTTLATLQHDATDAAWRTAGNQFVKLARTPLVGLLSRHLGPDDEALRGKIAAFLETELGTAILASLLSAGLSAVPGASPVPQRLARELRVRSMADASDLVADVLMGPLREVVQLYLKDLPAIGVEAVPSAPAGLGEGEAGRVVAMDARERAAADKGR